MSNEYIKIEQIKRIKTCSFIGENVSTKDNLVNFDIILDSLTYNSNVLNYIFFSDTEFQNYCYNRVLLLLVEFLNIKRIGIFFNNIKIQKKFEEIYYERKESGDIGELEQYKNIIDRSDFCVFSKIDLENKDSYFYKALIYAKVKNIKIIII